ncbi:sugar kinase [Virgibacillus natechei]
MDVITLGETMALFDPSTNGRIRYVDQFHKRIGGAESNLAIGLKRLGHDVGWISKLGNEELGHYVLSFIRGEGVDTSRVLMSDEALTGLYIKEKLYEGQSNVYYYRKYSAASRLSKFDIDWEYMKQAKVIHLTGITPFLSEECQELVSEIFQFSKKHHILISFDPNIRTKLWSDPETAKKRLLNLSEQSDLLIAGCDEIELLLGMDDVEANIQHFLDKGVLRVILKDGANGIYYGSKDERFGFCPSVKVTRVVDPVGAGDGFAAGVLSSLLEEKSLRIAVELGAVIGAIMVSTNGDIEGLPDKETIEQFTNRKRDVIR